MKIVSVPFSGGNLGKNLGCKEAPKIILEDIKHEVVQIDNNNIELSNNNIEEAEGDVFVGGDHSITYSLFKSFKAKNEGKEIGLVIFDAHPDCVNEFSPPTHEDFVRVLVEENIVKAENILLIGLRAIDGIEQEFLDDKGINYILMSDLGEDIIEELSERIKEFVDKLDSWYLSLDIDVIDPNEAPGTGYLEEEGFEFKELEGVLNNIFDFGKLGRIDLVEVNPEKDIENKTVTISKSILNIILDNSKIFN